MEPQTGWIKMHRKILDSACFNDPNPLVFKVWSYCLMQATHTQITMLRRREETNIEPGQFLFNRGKWAKALKASPSTIRNIVALLVGWEMIEQVNSEHRKETLFGVKNWSEYQNSSSYSARPESGHKKGHKEDTTKDTTINQFNRVEMNDNTEIRTQERTQERTQGGHKKDTTYIYNKNGKNLNTYVAEATEDIQNMKSFWKENAGTTLRNHLEGNLIAYNYLVKEVGDELPFYLQAVCLIRSDTYQKRTLQAKLINYVGLREKLEEVEAYMAGKIYTNLANQPV